MGHGEERENGAGERMLTKKIEGASYREGGHCLETLADFWKEPIGIQQLQGERTWSKGWPTPIHKHRRRRIGRDTFSLLRLAKYFARHPQY